MERPTLDQLIKHYDKFGLDKTKKVSRRAGTHEWEEPPHRTYRTLRDDSLVEIARAALHLGEYVEFIRHIAGDKMAEDALNHEKGDDGD